MLFLYLQRDFYVQFRNGFSTGEYPNYKKSPPPLPDEGIFFVNRRNELRTWTRLRMERGAPEWNVLVIRRNEERSVTPEMRGVAQLG